MYLTTLKYHASIPKCIVRQSLHLYNVSFKILTLKKSLVEPEFSVPYLIAVCLARSSALSIGDSILSTVKKAAKLAVYEEIMMSVKNHHKQATIRVDIACGAISQPSGKRNYQKASTPLAPFSCAKLWLIMLYSFQFSRQFDKLMNKLREELGIWIVMLLDD